MLREESSSAIIAGSVTFSKETERENQPQTCHGNPVCELILRCPFHPEPFRSFPFDQSQHQSAKDKDQQEVHREPEKTGNRKDLERQDTLIVNKELEEYRVVGRIDVQPAVNPRLKVPENDQ